MTTTTVLPGQPLSDTSGTSYKAGKGTFERGNGQIFSSLAGVLQRDGGVRASLNKSTHTWLKLVGQVLSVKGHSESTSVVPQEGSTVVGTVQKISKTQATLLIQTSDGKLVNGEFQGLIRSQDVRQTEQDKVQIYNCFRPRDVVRAAVVRFLSFTIQTMQADPSADLPRRRSQLLPINSSQ